MQRNQAGDFDYDSFGHGYASFRQADPRIERRVVEQLGNARSVVNVGAGAGSYEPTDRYVIAIEPSITMRAQRPRHLPPAIDARADALPLDDNSMDAAMSMLSVHHWPDPMKGLREMRRVTKGPIVILTFDPEEIDRLWLSEYVPEIYAADRKRLSFIPLLHSLEGKTEVHSVPIPIDCMDGFTEAFYARPEAFLDARVRSAQSVWRFADAAGTERGISRLADDLKSGAWDKRYGHLRQQPEFEGALKIIVNRPT